MKIRNRRLVLAHEDRVPLSVSTAQIPFPQHNDPRRLLMAANMQVYAVQVCDAEPPHVRTEVDSPQHRPYGVNLRVGYLAWRGQNHEDAWVISETAAQRLTTRQVKTIVVPIPSIELPAEVLVRPGCVVSCGQLLVQRRASPILLNSFQKVLARLGRFDAEAIIQPEPQELAPFEATVEEVEIWDFLQNKRILRKNDGSEDEQPFREDYYIRDDLISHYRQMIWVRMARELPLGVGDKLANRHGHKGIVGAILPDAEMPRWKGQPLEALIDPISVLNRSNWGQIYETLAAAGTTIPQTVPAGKRATDADWSAARAEGSDTTGRSQIHPPSNGTWMTQPTRAIAGILFVMRLPQHARERITYSPSPEPAGVKERAQRFGEMDHWALWAHGVCSPPVHDSGANVAPPWSKGTQRWCRLLAMAGYQLRHDGNHLILSRLPLDGEPPADAEKVELNTLTRRQAYKAVDAFSRNQKNVLMFDPPVEAVPYIPQRNQPKADQKQTIRGSPSSHSPQIGVCRPTVLTNSILLPSPSGM